MRPVLIGLVLFQLLAGQKIFEAFDLDKQDRYTGTTTYEFELDGKPFPEDRVWLLHLDNINGTLSLSGGANTRVKITEKITIWVSSERKARAVFDDHRARIYKLEDERIIKVTGKSSWKTRMSFDYTITLPRSFNVLAKTSGGDISALDLAGECRFRTSGGDIDIRALSGKITLNTSGGDITIERSEGAISAGTSGGDIDIRFTAGDIEAETSGGDMTFKSIQGDLSAKTSGGDISFFDVVGRSIQGTTSGGDIDGNRITGALEVHTSGGDIDLLDIDGNAHATTSGGDISIRGLFGNADLTTGGGELNVSGLGGAIQAVNHSGRIKVRKIWDPQLTDHNIILTGNSGSIILSLPGDFPARIDAFVEKEISMQMIDSEFPMSIIARPEGINGQATLGTGTYTIKLRTRNGSITIEKD